MSRVFLLVGLGLTVGCGGGTSGRDTAPIYEAILQHELEDQKNGEAVYLFIDGQAPPPELLDRLRQRWPTLQAGPKATKPRARRVALDGLAWIDRDTVEVRGGLSDGVDGRANLYRVVRKNGQWVVEKVELEAIS
jgi:hypothetical protein